MLILPNLILEEIDSIEDIVADTGRVGTAEEVVGFVEISVIGHFDGHIFHKISHFGQSHFHSYYNMATSSLYWNPHIYIYIYINSLKSWLVNN